MVSCRCYYGNVGKSSSMGTYLPDGAAMCPSYRNALPSEQTSSTQSPRKYLNPSAYVVFIGWAQSLNGLSNDQSRIVFISGDNPENAEETCFCIARNDNQNKTPLHRIFLRKDAPKRECDVSVVGVNWMKYNLSVYFYPIRLIRTIQDP